MYHSYTMAVPVIDPVLLNRIDYIYGFVCSYWALAGTVFFLLVRSNMAQPTNRKRTATESPEDNSNPKRLKTAGGGPGSPTADEILRRPGTTIREFLTQTWTAEDDDSYHLVRNQISLARILGAICSITEAVSDKGLESFSFIDSSVFKSGKQADVSRPGSEIFIPANIKKGNKIRVVLLSASLQSDSDVPTITYWDTLKAPDSDKKARLKAFLNQLNGLKWHSGDLPRDSDAFSRLRTERMPYSSNTESSVHVVLTAWAHVIGLRINEKFEVNDEKDWKNYDFFEQARCMIFLAIQGRVSSAALASFLIFHEYVQHPSIDELENATDLFDLSFHLDIFNITDGLSERLQNLHQSGPNGTRRRRRQEVKPGACTFDHSLLLRAIASVTEAINENGEDQIFGLANMAAFQAAVESQDENNIKNSPVAGRQRHLILPWKDRSLAQPARRLRARTNSRLEEYYFLISLRTDEQNRPRLELVGDLPDTMSLADHIFVQGKILTVLEKFHWPDWDDAEVDGRLVYTGGVYQSWPPASLPGHSHNCPAILVLIAWMIALGIPLAAGQGDGIVDPALGAAANRLLSQAIAGELRSDDLFEILRESSLRDRSVPLSIAPRRGFQNTKKLETNEQYEELFRTCLEQDYAIKLSYTDPPTIDTSARNAATSHGALGGNNAVGALSDDAIYSFWKRNKTLQRIRLAANKRGAETAELLTYGAHLSMEEMLPAIYSVTEAIHATNQQANSDGPSFSLMTLGTQGLAQSKENNQEIPPVHRPHATFFLPHVDSALSQIPERANANFQDYKNARTAGHIRLFMLEPDGDTANVVVRVYDSSFHTGVKAMVRGNLLADVIDFMNRVQWWPENQLNDQKVRIANSLTRQECPGQSNGWACGVHTILNAWTIAMGLSLNRNERMNPAFYQDAVDIINLAVEGYMDYGTIHAFLLYYRFVLNDDNGKDVPENRRFTNTVAIQDADAIQTLYDELQ